MTMPRVNFRTAFPKFNVRIRTKNTLRYNLLYLLSKWFHQTVLSYQLPKVLVASML